MIGEGFYNSQLIAFWAVWASCVRRKLIWPQSIFCEAGGGEGLGRCFLPDCPFCIVYQLSTDQFVWLWPGRGGTAGESWEVKATPVRVDATWKDNLTCMDLRWEDIVELLHDRNISQQTCEECESKHCNQTVWHYWVLTPWWNNLSLIAH